MTLRIGATTAVFSVVRGVLLTPLPYREPHRIVLFRVDFPGYTRQPLLTGEERAALQERTDLSESAASIFDNEGSLTSPDVMRSVKACRSPTLSSRRSASRPCSGAACHMSIEAASP